MDNIEQNIKELIADKTNINVNEISLHSHLKNDLNLDSFDLMELIMDLEVLYYINIDDDVTDDFTNVQTVNDAIIFIKQKIE